MDVRVVGYQEYDWSSPVPAHRRPHGAGYLGVAAPQTGHESPSAGRLDAPITEFSVVPGDLVLYLPYEDHSYRPECGGSLQAAVIRFELPAGSSLSSSARLLGTDRLFRQLPHVGSMMRYVSEQLLLENEYATRAAEAATAALLYSAVATRVRILPVTRESPVDSAMEALFSDFSARLGDIAAGLGLSVETIRKEFRRHFGDSPMHYFASFRIASIAFRLETDDTPLQELAEQYGFYDEFHMSRVFKKHVGEPPGEYRKRHR
jgi:AraC-like DNA-binding protein